MKTATITNPDAKKDFEVKSYKNGEYVWNTIHDCKSDALMEILEWQEPEWEVREDYTGYKVICVENCSKIRDHYKNEVKKLLQIKERSGEE